MFEELFGNTKKLPKRKVVLEGSDGVRHWTEIEPVFQEFASALNIDIYVGIGRGGSEGVRIEDGKLHVRLWCCPTGSKIERYTKGKLFGYPLQDGQGDGLRTNPIGIPIFDKDGTLAADIVGGTMFVLFDISYKTGGGKVLRRILEEYAAVGSEKREMERGERRRKIQEASKGAYVTYRNRHLESQKSELTDKARTAECDIKCYQKKIMETVHVMRDAKEKLQFFENIAAADKKHETEWEKLCHLSGVEYAYMEDGILSVVLSEEIHISYNDVMYDIGKFRLDIDKENGDVTAHNLTRRVDDGDYYHPHVLADGECCFGDISDGIAQLIGNEEDIALVQVMMRFLQSYNDENPYTSITKFPVVDESENKEAKGGEV